MLITYWSRSVGELAWWRVAAGRSGQGVITGEHRPATLATAESAHWIITITPGARLITVEGVEAKEHLF